jgi:competence protein CoiA
MERNLGAVRPDISAYLDDVPIAVEVQLSALSLDTIRHRTAEYEARGIYVLWLPLYAAGLRRELYRPRPWERWLHAAYFGRVYYWLEGLRVVPVHFRDYRTEVRGRTRTFQKLSDSKVPLEGPPLVLTEDFQPRRRDAWSHESLAVPRARLLVDVKPRWY